MAFDFASGPVSFISYAYFFIYEFLSPFVELFGLFVTLLAVLAKLMELKMFLMLTLTYSLFGMMLTVASFFARTQATDIKLTFADTLRVFGSCLFEATFMHFVLTYVRATAFFGYKKKRLQWGRIERKKINLK
jgi:hypothetical protein